MAGAGYKLFNTGDVLTAAQVNTYLQEQVVMVFNDATARTTALSGVLAEGMVSYLKSTKVVEIYNGTAWASLDDPNAIQNTIVDAKGDLISASGNDVPARLAVGSNGESIVADSSTSTGLRWQPAKSVNYCLNSAMQIWQRGTSFTVTSGSLNYYTSDRWQAYRNATGMTVSRQVTNDTTNLPFIQYAARIARDSGNTSTAALSFFQNLETGQSIPLAGRTITFSFYARAGANFSSASSVLTSKVFTGTGTDQNILIGFTNTATPINNNVTLTTTWQRFQASATLSSSATQIAFSFECTPVGTAGANDWYEVTGVQLEIGSIATAFQTATGTLAGELQLAQRYYEKSNDIATSPTTSQTSGFINCLVPSNTVANQQRYNQVYFKVTKRTSPTMTIRPYTTPADTGRVSNAQGVDLGAGSGALLNAAESSFSIYNNSGGSLTTTDQTIVFHYEASAEL